MRNPIFETKIFYELSFGKNNFCNFARKFVIYTCLGKISKFVFAKTQFVIFFRFKNRIPRAKKSLPCSQIDIGVPIAIHELQSFMFFFLVFGRDSTFRKFSSYGPNPGPWALCRGCGGRSPPLVYPNLYPQQYIYI